MLLIGELLRRQAAFEAYGARDALRMDGTAVTYTELDRWSNRLAHALLRLGLRPGDRLALLDRNSPAWVAAYFAAARAGVILVPLNFWHRTDELRYALVQSGAVAVIASPEFAPLLRALPPTLPAVRHWLWIEQPTTEAVPAALDAWPALDSLASGESDTEPGIAIDERDPHIVLYTSGTTGYPKGATVSHRAHILHAMTFALHAAATSVDVYLNVYPLFHTGGTDCAIIPYFTAGATVVLLRRPTAAGIAEAIAREGVTAMMAVPTLWRQLLALPNLSAYELGSLRRAMGSSDVMPRDLLEALLAQLPVSWTQTYGLTEAGCILTYLQPADQFRKLGSVGKPHAQAEVRIVDEHDCAVPPGEVGEVVALTAHAMDRYWNMPEETERTFRNGWLHTGDLGRMDDDGYLFITGRLKDMVVTGGEKVYPAEVEAVLAQHPAVQAVAVIGIPDHVWGEAVLAVVVLLPGAQVSPNELTAFARPRLAGYKCPRFVEFVAELPRTGATGKVQKGELRRRFAHRGHVS